MPTIYLVDLVGHDGATTRTVRYSSGDGYNHPSAGGYYEPRLLQPANLRRTAFANGTTFGAVETGYGELVLANPDGLLDGLLDLGFDGRPLTLRIGDDKADIASFETLLLATVEQPVFDFARGTVTFRVRDRLQELAERPLNATRYAGSNSLPNGLEGLPADLKARPKPRCYGSVFNISPPLVNTARWIFQVNDGAVSDVPAVHDAGVPYTKGAPYTSQSDMETNAPMAGQYRVWPAGGYFRLTPVGTNVVGPLTCDVVQGASASDRTAAEVLRALATGPGLIPIGDVTAGDVTALDTANSAEVGTWIGPEERSVAEAMTEVCNAVGAWFGFDRLGKLRMRRIEAPSGTPAVELRSIGYVDAQAATDGDLLDLERLATNDDGRGVPAYRVTVGYQRNYTVQTDGFGGAATAQRRAFSALDYRTAVATDATVQTKHLLAPELRFDTALVTEAAAQAEATRRLNLYKVRRDRVRARVKFGPETAGLVDLGSVVRVRIPRFGYGSGRLFTVIGLEYDAANDIADLTLWG